MLQNCIAADVKSLGVVAGSFECRYSVDGGLDHSVYY